MTNPIDAALAALDAAGVELPLRQWDDEVVTDARGIWLTATPQERVLFIAAVNALPEVRRMREELERLKLDLLCEKGVRSMTVDRLEGTVESGPTHEGNFLQRIDELREIERGAEQLRERVSVLEAALRNLRKDADGLIKAHAAALPTPHSPPSLRSRKKKESSKLTLI